MHASERGVRLRITVSRVGGLLIILILDQVLLLILVFKELELITWWNCVTGSVELGHGLNRFQALFIPFILVVPLG